MSKAARAIYHFGPFQLDAAERLLLRDGAPVPLPPKVFDTLMTLVENSGHLMVKDELMSRLWPDTFVEEVTLARNISDLRKALGEGADGEKYIETVPRRGYRFTANVRALPVESAALIVERHARARVVIEQETGAAAPLEIEPVRAKPKRSLIFMIATAALVSLIAASFIWWLTVGSKQNRAGAAIRSIAVLPFKPLVADNRDESLELGMADTLITRLGNTGQIQVRPISAVRKYMALDQDPIDAGREQQVDAVLEGSIQWRGDKIRVTARLLRVADGKTLWADRCDQQCTDIFAVQDSISERLAGWLALRLSDEQRRLLSKHYTESAEAYQLYAKGRYHLFKRTSADTGKAVNYYQQAIALDPNYAPAYAGLAYAYESLAMLSQAPAKEVMPKAKATVEQALRIDDQLAEAHAVMGDVKYLFEWDWAAAEQELTHAVGLNPNSADARHLLAMYWLCVGRLDEAIAEIKRAVELDPTSLHQNRNLGMILYMARRYDEAIEQLQKTLDMDSNYHTAYNWLVASCAAKGEYDQAIAWNLKQRSLADEAAENLAALKKAYKVGGWRGYWQKVLAFTRQRAQERYFSPNAVAGLCLRAGERDQALAWLERALQERDDGLVYLKVDPAWDSLRADPRFQDLLRHVGLAP